jgi:hypothetical protein
MEWIVFAAVFVYVVYILGGEQPPRNSGVR